MNIRGIAKLVAGNLLVLLALLAIGSLVLRGVSYLQMAGDGAGVSWAANDRSNRKPFRATYPPYRHLDPEYAYAIFNEQDGPSMFYVPFSGWRRLPRKGRAVNVEEEYRTRLSTNHQINDSVWFLGGSTMWGTGADDANTIPSLYAEITGEPVWNLGEGGYISFQELAQLMAMLAKGLKPRLVVFYDGVNERLYCNANNDQYPSHRRAQLWDQVIREYPKLKRDNERLQQVQESQVERSRRISVFAEFGRTVRSTVGFFTAPYRDLFRKATDKSVLAGRLPASRKTDTPFKEFRAKANYHICDRSQEKRELAARTTVETWLLASDILKARGIELKIFLQPSARIAPETLNLDYLADSTKQHIANEAPSFQAQYKAIKRVWSESCATRDACDAFHDISTVFSGLPDPIFVDPSHVGHQGNRIVAERMHEIISAGENALAAGDETGG